MNFLIRLIFNKGFLILVGVVAVVLVNERMQWVDTTPFRDGLPDAPRGVVEEGAPAGLSGTQSKVTQSSSQITPTPRTSANVSIEFPYTEAIRNEPYYLEWSAPSGNYATIRLLHTGDEAEAVPGCTALTVTPGVVATCVWKPGQVDQIKSREGYSLELSVYNESGDTLGTAKTKPFTMVTTITTPLISYEDETHGWSIRYPESWTKKLAIGKAVFAEGNIALQNPNTSDEALTIEFCSLAHVDCQSKRDTFLMLPGAKTGSLVNKRTTMLVTPSGDAYRRQDMFERSGILFVVTTRAVTREGAFNSPYTRKALEEISFEAPRLSSETYTFSRSSRTGSLILEYTDGRITYARLLSAANGCESKLDTTSFNTNNAAEFSIVRGTCTITAEKSSDRYTVTEKECDSIHTGSCTFEGTYDLD